MPACDSILSLPGKIGLGILAKEPRPGQVKTRLTPPLTPEEAAALYRICLDETVASFGSGPLHPHLFYSGNAAFFAQRYPRLPRQPQGNGSLGDRLHTAMLALFASGCTAAVLIGSDSPDLPPPLVIQAAAALATTDAAAIPAADGGYVLIAARRPVPQLFSDIPWSSAEVFSVTRARARRHGIDLAEVGGWEDVDDLASLQRLLLRSPNSATADFARRQLGHYLTPAVSSHPAGCAAAPDRADG